LLQPPPLQGVAHEVGTNRFGQGVAGRGCFSRAHLPLRVGVSIRLYFFIFLYSVTRLMPRAAAARERPNPLLASARWMTLRSSASRLCSNESGAAAGAGETI